MPNCNNKKLFIKNHKKKQNDDFNQKIQHNLNYFNQNIHSNQSNDIKPLKLVKSVSMQSFLSPPPIILPPISFSSGLNLNHSAYDKQHSSGSVLLNNDTNTILTDIGICVRMSNVNLNNDLLLSAYSKYNNNSFANKNKAQTHNSNSISSDKLENNSLSLNNYDLSENIVKSSNMVLSYNSSKIENNNNKKTKSLIKDSLNRRKNKDDSSEELIAPPPKKKWIRHYMMEDPYFNGHSPSYQNTNNVSKTITANHSDTFKNNFSNSNQKISSNGIVNGRKLKFVPLTPPPMPSKKLVESSRIRSISLSSNKITVNGIIGSGPSSTTTITSIVGNNVLAATTEDSSQSSLNLSSSGYLSGSSVNSSIGGSNLNLNNSIAGGATNSLLSNGNENSISVGNIVGGSGRRRTTSTNSNGGTQRSPCVLRAGTREVHNKLEKHRRAHLKECFEQLKSQLQLKDEEKKKTSNLAILGAAFRHVKALRLKERELEQQVEQLAKEKINAQKKLVSLKRELSSKYDNIDFPSIIGDGENIPERADTLSSGRDSIRYSSSSSLSSVGNVISSPLGAGMSVQMSPILPTNSGPNSMKAISSPTTCVPLSLTSKNLNTMAMQHQRGSPPMSSIPSPSASSSGVSSSSSASPPIGLKAPTNLNGLKIAPNHSTNNNINNMGSSINNIMTSIQSSVGGNFSKTSIINITSTDNGIMIPNNNNHNSIPLNLNTSQSLLNGMMHTKDLSGKNGINRKLNIDTNDISSPSRLLLNCSNNNTNNNISTGNIGCGKDFSNNINNKMDDSEHPTKVIKLFNGIALAPVDKDNKIISSLSQVVGIPMLSQGLRVINTSNGLATIELSSPTIQTQQPRGHQNNSIAQPINTIGSNAATQLHKLLINNSGVNGSMTPATILTSTPASVIGVSSNGKPIFTHANTDGRLPGGAELNILPPNGTSLYRNLALVNNANTLKGSEPHMNNTRAVHVVSNLTPIVMSQGQPGNNYTHAILSSQQISGGKVNLSVNGQTLPLLSSVKPMVVVSNGSPNSSASTGNGNCNS